MKGSTTPPEDGLATLNFITAGLNALMLPGYAYLWWITFFNTTQLRLLLFLFLLILVNVVLCFGFVVGWALRKGQSIGREAAVFLTGMTLCLLVLTLLSFVFAAGETTICRGPHWFSTWLMFVGPVIFTALGYCVLVPVFLLRASRTAPLSLEQILAWADQHHAVSGQWPRPGPEAIISAPDETWEGIDRALREGLRGLPGNHTLEDILCRFRGPTG